MFAADTKNPWALAHGVTALGANFVAADGRKAADVMIGDFLLENRLPDGGPGQGARFGFARYGADGTPIEPHTNLIAKTLVLAGVPLSTRYKTRWGAVTLKELVDEAKKSFRHTPASDEYWKDVAWTLDLFSQTTPPTDPELVKVMDEALGELERATLDLKNGMGKGDAMVPKRKQGIYAHPCGGLHFVQAVLSWARHPEVRKRWGTRVDTQVAILFYRLESERQQYDAALEAGGREYRLQVLTQMVKFYGHFLETTARLKTDLKWSPDAAQKQAIARAKAYLDSAVRALDADKVLGDEKMKQLKTSQPQIYLDLIGDSCHASHGWDGWP
ncbi:MAG: hypothetical protein IPJ65_18710 [Archangiaceae bacterium]|nr:hypothetical protein [Archangiaceae bacterium]